MVLTMKDCIDRLKSYTHLIEDEPKGITFLTRLGIAEVFSEHGDIEFAAKIVKEGFIDYNLIQHNEDCLDFLDSVLIVSKLENKER